MAAVRAITSSTSNMRILLLNNSNALLFSSVSSQRSAMAIVSRQFFTVMVRSTSSHSRCISVSSRQMCFKRHITSQLRSDLRTRPDSTTKIRLAVSTVALLNSRFRVSGMLLLELLVYSVFTDQTDHTNQTEKKKIKLIFWF